MLDGTAGSWCCNAGHGRRGITEAIRRQAGILDFAPPSSWAIRWCLRRRRGSPPLPRPGSTVCSLVNSGSEAADTAPQDRARLPPGEGPGAAGASDRAREGYHGVGFGGMSVGGIPANRRQFGAHLPYVDHLPHTHLPEVNAFSRGQPEHGAHLADALESLVALHGADTIAAVMVEPVAGSTGVLVPPKGYLERLRAICNRHGILLIFDEVITGFGRLGATFGAERLGVVPDMITMAKGITNAAVPMGAVAVEARDPRRHHIEAAPAGIEFFHGYTAIPGHPLAAAAAIATLDLHRAARTCPAARAPSNPFGEGGAQPAPACRRCGGHPQFPA